MPRSNNIIPHLSIRESFRDRQSVLNNGWDITGSPTIDNGLSGISASDYLSFNHTLNVSYSFFFRVNIISPLPGSFEYLLGPATQKFKIIWSTAAGGYYYLTAVIGGTNRVIGTTNLGGLYEGQEISVGFAVDYDGVNTTLSSYVNGVIDSTQGPYAGIPAIQDDPIKLGISHSDTLPTTHEIKEFQIYSDNLVEKDFLELHNNTISYNIQPFQSRIFLPGKREYVNTSGDKVTPIIGTSGVTEAVMGDGTTSTTFPTRGDDNLWTFDGGDYINLGDNDNFSFTKSDPITIGCLLSVSDLTIKQGIMAKGTSGVTLGEWVLYTAGSKIRYGVIDDSENAYRILLSSVITTYLGNNELFSLVITYDGSGTFDTTTVGMYVNGINRISSISTSGVFTDIENTSINFVVGAFSEPSTYITGKLGFPFMIFQELSPLQVQMIHDNMMRWRTM